ncbi:MAG: hypothetical protein B6I24_07095 [Bacteroidetes bacterium 4572_128]|nr:MAG: hypothetical protein B6I24_07095 [Bacteroidetes bacterium 4572_128]
MYKKLLLILGIFFLLSNYSYSQQNFKAFINLTVTDMKDKPSVGDHMLFVSDKTGKILSSITKKGGLCKFEVPSGAVYTIKIKSYSDTVTLYKVEIQKANYDQNFELTLKYQLPKTYTLKNVNFQSGSSKLKSSSFKSLNELAELMLNKKTLKIELAGHTDSQGDDALNLKLSHARAKVLKNYLVKKGITAKRLIVKGYGETRPIANNATEEGRKKNRRTEVIIIER